MHKIVVLAVVAAGLGLAGCTPAQQGAAFGAATGAVVGGLATDTVRGAAAGAAIGAATGLFIGLAVQGQPGKCYAVDQNGNYLYYDQYGQVVPYQTPNPVIVDC